MSSHLISPETGNTCQSPARSRCWVFTWNNPTDDTSQHLISLMDVGCEKYVFQLERGENGTPHFQGCFYLKLQKSFSAVKKWIGDEPHLESCRDWRASIKYCSKEETRIGRIFSKGVKIEEGIVDKLKVERPNDFQAKLLKVLAEPPDDRSIYWVYDREGGAGKTTLARHLCLTRNAIYVSGKASDVKFAVAKYVEDKGSVDIVIYSLTRSMENFMSYEAIESVKDGIFFCGKYESGMCIYNHPHVVVMANCEPDLEKLTMDRWRVINV